MNSEELRVQKEKAANATFLFGGDDGSRTHVRKSIPETFYERSLSFKLPLKKRRQTGF